MSQGPYSERIGIADVNQPAELTFPRLQLFEFHDMPWFPRTLRLGATESLRVLAEQVGLAETVAPLIKESLEHSEVRRIIDLCSGSCGPLVPLVNKLGLRNRGVEVIATDRYPSQSAFNKAAKASKGAIQGHSTPVDARKVPASLTGMRTLFNAFHHFPPAEAKAILEDAHNSRQPIAIFEITNRSFGRTLGVFPGSILLAMSTAWKSTSAPMQLLSFVLPVLPLTFAWDGLVSCFRTYTADELSEMVEGLDDNYEWRFGQKPTKRGIFSITYLLGTPKKRPENTNWCKTPERLAPVERVVRNLT